MEAPGGSGSLENSPPCPRGAGTLTYTYCVECKDEAGNTLAEHCCTVEVVCPPAPTPFETVLASAEDLARDGAIPQATVEALNMNAETLMNNEEELVKFAAVSEFVRNGTDGRNGGEAAGAGGGGIVNGTMWTALSLQGLVVGTLSLSISWAVDAGDPCRTNINATTFSGGLINGTVTPAQIGILFDQACVAGAGCVTEVRHCGNFQLQCMQQVGMTTVNVNTLAEMICAACPTVQPRFLRGDVNGDGEVVASVTDMVFYANRVFLGRGNDFPCRAAADANGDGFVGGSTDDIIFLSNFLFLGFGPPPPPPFPSCGLGNAQDATIGCAEHPCNSP